MSKGLRRVALILWLLFVVGNVVLAIIAESTFGRSLAIVAAVVGLVGLAL